MRTFGWEEKNALAKQNGSKVACRLGVGIGYHGAGGRGYDGLVRIGTDGKALHSQRCRQFGLFPALAPVVPRQHCRFLVERCEIVRGRTDKHLPHSSGQGGSNTIFTHTRTNWVAAQDAIAKLKEIAAQDLGGTPEDYSIGDERVFATAEPSRGLSYAQAAARAIELGGKFSGQEYPDDINPITQRACKSRWLRAKWRCWDNIPGEVSLPDPRWLL